MNFKSLITDLEVSPEVLEIGDISSYITSFIDNEENKDFLLSLLSEKNNNIPYLRNIYTIIIWLFNENKKIDFLNIKDYLYKELKNQNLREWVKIIFTNLIIKISNETYLKKIVEIYNKQINDNSISIWNIESFTDYFCEYEKWEKFVDSFLYFHNDWGRWSFIELKEWLNSRQNWILSLKKKIYIYFLNELWTKNSLKEYVWQIKDKDYEGNFNQKIIDKWFELWLEEDLYNFLVSLIKYWNDWKNNFYKEKVYYKQIQDFFNKYRKFNNVDNFFIKFFNDINYDKKWFYYFNFFEKFIANVLLNKEDIKLFFEVESVKNNNYMFAYRIYNYLKEIWKKELVSEFEFIIWDKIKEIEVMQEEWKKNNDKYLKKYEKEKYNEIKNSLETLSKNNERWFFPIIFKYYLENEELLFSFESELYDINKIIRKQIDYFLKWENLNPWNIEALRWLEKTDSWYNWFTWYFDESLWLVLQVSEKLWFDLSSYTHRLCYYIPFQIWDSPLQKLINLCWLEEFEKVFDVYNNYPIIAGFHPQNIITYYQKVKNEIDIDLNTKVLEFLKTWILKYKSFYDKEKVLGFLNEFWETNKYFQTIFNENKSDINYFYPWSTISEEYQNFRLALKANEVLMKNWDFKALKWRLKQIKSWKTENREYKNWFLPDDEINLWDDNFITIFKEIKNSENIIIDSFIDLLEYSFNEYEDKYINYCFYIFRSFNYYLSWLNNLSKDIYLILKLSEILSKTDKLDAVIYFKRNIDEFENGLFLSNVEKEILKSESKKNDNKHLESIISEQLKIIGGLKNKLNNDTESKILIFTESITDYSHFYKSFFELSKVWLVKMNLMEFFIKQKNIKNPIIVNWSCTETYQYIKKIIYLNPKKIVIWIFDTDDVSFLDNENDKNIFKKDLFLSKAINSDNNNFFIFGLWYWDSIKHLDKTYEWKLCIELMYDESFLEWKILTRKFYNNNYYHKILSQNVYKNIDYYYSLTFKWKFIHDELDGLKTYNSMLKDITDDINSWTIQIERIFIKKSEFAKNIEEWIYDNELNIDIWKRFLPIFNKIEDIIGNYSKDNVINILNNKQVPYISSKLCLFDKIKLFIRNLF